MRILVTGATGYLGSHFCQMALRAGHDVIGCVRRRTEALATMTSSVIVQDILTLTADSWPEAIDTVVHFATGTSGSEESVLKVALEGTHNIYTLALSRGIKRFVHISSISVYAAGPVGWNRLRADGFPLEPWPERRGVYAQSKTLADLAIQQMAQSPSHSAMEVYIVRPGLVFGPDMKDILAGTAVSLPLDLLVGIGSPTQSVPLLDIRELSAGLLALAETGVSSGTLKIWNILSPELPTKRRFLQEYTRLTGRGHRQLWIPRFVAMGGAYMLEALFAIHRSRKYLPYKVKRLYDFDAKHLHSDFWSHVGIDPKRDVCNCIESAVTTGLNPPLSRLDSRAEITRKAEALLNTTRLDLPHNRAFSDIIIVGSGRIVSEMHVPALKRMPGYRVHAVIDPNLELARKVASEFPEARAYKSIDEVENARWSSSTAVIATPGYTHFHIARRLLDQGADLLIEKPVTLAPDEFEQLFNAARCTNTQVTVFQTYRLRANVLQLWDFLSKHDVGALVKAQVTFHSGRIITEQARWSHDEKCNRVLIMELAIHFLDLVCLVAGELSDIIYISRIDRDDGKSTVSITGVAKSRLGAEVHFDLDLSGAARRTQITLDFERCASVLDFFPEGFRILPERCNPIDDTAAAWARLYKFAYHTLWKNSHGIPKRALPHFWIYRQHLLKLQRQPVQEMFSLEAVAATMRSLYRLTEPVYSARLMTRESAPVGLSMEASANVSHKDPI